MVVRSCDSPGLLRHRSARVRRSRLQNRQTTSVQLCVTWSAGHVSIRQRCPDQDFIQGSSRPAEVQRRGKGCDWFTAVNRPGPSTRTSPSCYDCGPAAPGTTFPTCPSPRFTAVNPPLGHGLCRSSRASISRAPKATRTVYRGKPARPRGSSCARQDPRHRSFVGVDEERRHPRHGLPR